MARGDLHAMFATELASLDDPALRRECSAYLDYHARRYASLMAVLGDLLAARSAPRILDVGPMFETAMLRATGATVDTLGFANPLFPPRADERHLEVDLNAPAEAGDGSYDAVVLAEVIEHLTRAPATVLGWLATWLRPDGWIVVQTPNAVALHKRLRMLAGRNPIDPIRTDDRNPGHFHEYTLSELHRAAAQAGLAVGGWRAENYFGANRAYAALGRVLPPSLRHGITVWLRRG